MDRQSPIANRGPLDHWIMDHWIIGPLDHRIIGSWIMGKIAEMRGNLVEMRKRNCVANRGKCVDVGRWTVVGSCDRGSCGRGLLADRDSCLRASVVRGSCSVVRGSSFVGRQPGSTTTTAKSTILNEPGVQMWMESGVNVGRRPTKR
jgi:hypothetical protein